MLYRLRLAGVLEDLTLREIGKVLGIGRATVVGDLRDLDAAEAEFQAMMEEQPWAQWSSSEAERDVDDEVEALKRLTRDGLVWLRHWVTPDDV